MTIVIGITVFLIVLAFAIRRSNKISSTTEISEKVVKIPARWGQINYLLLRNALPSIYISPANERPTSVYQSKIGGQPYWPTGKGYPVDDDGKNLTFIAQINLSEVGDNPLALPDTGILQFFIKLDDLMGLTFFESSSELNSYINNENKKYSVVYHANPNDQDAALTAVDQTISEDDSPISGQCTLLFSSAKDKASPHDYRWNNIVKELAPFSDDETQYAFNNLARARDHKIGGYASFTQQDPREHVAPEDNWILLLQLDSESNDHMSMMWGDVGIAQFFIRQEDLEALRFDRVWYNWDCY